MNEYTVEFTNKSGAILDTLAMQLKAFDQVEEKASSHARVLLDEFSEVNWTVKLIISKGSLSR